MRYPIIRAALLVFTCSMLLLAGGCESLPRFAAPELPDLSRMFPDVSSMLRISGACFPDLTA
jgi:hypothetical protein